MCNELIQSDAGRSGGPQIRDALARLEQVVLDGLQHGYFRCTVSSIIGKGNRRELVIEAGKSHKFTIPEEDLPRCGERVRIPICNDRQNRWPATAAGSSERIRRARPMRQADRDASSSSTDGDHDPRIARAAAMKDETVTLNRIIADYVRAQYRCLADRADVDPYDFCKRVAQEGMDRFAIGGD
jgi:hypothetical protein